MRGILWLSEVTEQVLKLELAAVLTGYYSLCVGYKHHSYRHRTSCRVVGCTWGDTRISGHSLCPHRCADSLRCHGYMLLWLHETRQHYITACFAGVNRCCVCVSMCQLHVALHIQIQSLWFLASSNPGRHSQATPPLGVSLQMWAQPCSLFIQLRPSEVERGLEAHTETLLQWLGGNTQRHTR